MKKKRKMSLSHQMMKKKMVNQLRESRSKLILSLTNPLSRYEAAYCHTYISDVDFCPWILFSSHALAVLLPGHHLFACNHLPFLMVTSSYLQTSARLDMLAECGWALCKLLLLTQAESGLSKWLSSDCIHINIICLSFLSPYKGYWTILNSLTQSRYLFLVW